MNPRISDLDLAFDLADNADRVTLKLWSPQGVKSKIKADGIDGTSGFVAGLPTWETLIALEQDGEIRLGIISSPSQDKRWWAQSGFGAFTGTCDSNRSGRQIRVLTNTHDCKSRCYFAPVQKPSSTSPTVY